MDEAGEKRKMMKKRKKRKKQDKLGLIYYKQN